MIFIKTCIQAAEAQEVIWACESNIFISYRRYAWVCYRRPYHAIPYHARSVCLVTLSLSEAGPGRFGRQVSVTDIYHTTIPYHTIPYLPYHTIPCPQHAGVRRSSVPSTQPNLAPWPLEYAVLLVPLRSVQFSSEPATRPWL